MEPIAKRLKQSAESALYTTRESNTEKEIAERIRRLEAELQDGSHEDSSTSDSDSDNDKTKTVVSLSAYASDRIESLPDNMLPPARPSSVLPSVKKKRKKTQQEENEQAANKTLELLGDALTFPKKVPFACKPCKFIGKNIEDLKAHRASEEHLKRAEAGDKALHCVLCNKSFTSQAQVDEHRLGKWHKQRAQQKKERRTVKVCYDFMRGECKWGDRCNFEHTETKAMRSGCAFKKTRSRVCSSFAQTKKCRFGDKCLFSHDTK
ncbi:unnamed protein product [Peronospora belbahrii]|uniref:C3H1-type domain-containing protein n=1 Tax=Peronospora belbahrii TaxID=622444 RepID=A0AAU9KJ23_9STRA|nr:unnamed protein product [Peronospora belbahrii]CAH0517558.1 unnamed protein product [Peronospora belbahrii]